MAITAICASSYGGNILTNPGFEADSAGQTKNIQAWTLYSPSTANVYGETGPPSTHGGHNDFKVFQAFNSAVNYSGIYQDVLSGPGAIYAANVWAYTSSSDTIAGQNVAWAEVTFRDAASHILALYRSAHVTAQFISSGSFRADTWTALPITNQYNPISDIVTNHTDALVAPPEAAFVRYQIVFQGDAHNSAGSMYFDDLSLNQINGSAYGNWNIVWSDEFNETSLNRNVWTFDTGGGGWGNSELEYYTSSSQNSYVSNGLLHVVALRQAMGGFDYTSARLKSEGLYEKKFGRFEWRARLPAGLGFWPALWMLGANFHTIGWPACGEVDVMENGGGVLGQVQGSLHSGSDETLVYTLPGGSVTNFHTYTLDWTTNAFSFYVDGLRYQTQTNWSSSAGSYPVPFNQPFFIVMNLAVGGNYVGNPSTAQINAHSTFPAEMQVDYVRVYDLTPPLQLSAASAGGDALLGWPTNIVCHLQSASTLSGPWSDQTPASNPFSITPAITTFYRLASP